MSPYGYIQLFVLGLLCSAAISEENVTCTTPRAQSNIHVNQVYGDWFMAQVNIPANHPLNKSGCLMFSAKKINESTFETAVTNHGVIRREVFSIEDAENAGTWHNVDEDMNQTVKVIYLSADGTAMAIAYCASSRVEPHCMLFGKQLPISSELAEIPGSHCNLTWKSEATCPST